VVEVDVRGCDHCNVLGRNFEFCERVEDQFVVSPHARIDECRAVVVDDVGAAVLRDAVQFCVDVVEICALACGRLVDIAACHI
jgi:hypothetical protein